MNFGGAFMQLDLGQKIRELRRRDGRTQEALAEAIGVTSQAVSRWEANGGYPDMEMIPAIANYFHVSIDELFGYQNDREDRIKRILEEAKKQINTQGYFLGRGHGDYEGCVQMLREAAMEFPNEPEILFQFAEALHRLGWQKHGRAILMKDDDKDHFYENVEYNTKNSFWLEALQVYEKLLKMYISSERRGEIVLTAVMIYRSMGEYEKSKALACTQDSMHYSKEALLPRAVVGKEVDQANGESVLACLHMLDWVMSYAVTHKPDAQISEYDRSIILAIAHMYELVFNDGRCGCEHWTLGRLYLKLSKLEVIYGENIQKAITAFDKSFAHYKAYKDICGQGDYQYSAPLVSKVTVSGDKLPAVWDEYWKGILNGMPDSLLAELRQIPKYAECFE